MGKDVFYFESSDANTGGPIYWMDEAVGVDAAYEVTITRELEDYKDRCLAPEVCKMISDRFDALVMEVLRDGCSIDIAVKRVSLRRALGCLS